MRICDFSLKTFMACPTSCSQCPSCLPILTIVTIAVVAAKISWSVAVGPAQYWFGPPDSAAALAQPNHLH